MKSKILCFIVTLFFCQLSFAAFPVVAAKDSVIVVSSDETAAAVKAFTTMTAKEYAKFTGKKLNFFERIAFKIAQKKARLDPQFAEEVTRKFSFLGFFVGILFPPFGVLAAQFSRDPVFRRSAWIGFGVALIIVGLILLSYASSFGG